MNAGKTVWLNDRTEGRGRQVPGKHSATSVAGSSTDRLGYAGETLLHAGQHAAEGVEKQESGRLGSTSAKGEGVDTGGSHL